MKKITQKEANELQLKVGRNGRNPVLDELKKLDVGEILKIEQKDWKPKSTPGVIVAGSFRNGKKFSIRSLVAGGWVATRVK